MKKYFVCELPSNADLSTAASYKAIPMSLTSEYVRARESARSLTTRTLRVHAVVQVICSYEKCDVTETSYVD